MEPNFRAFLEAAPEAMLIADRDGRILFANSQAETMFRATKQQLLDARVEDLLPMELRNRHQRYREEYFENPQRRPMGAGLELSARRLDGTEVPVEISLSPLHVQEGIVVLAAVRDITYRKVAESRQREEQERVVQCERLAAVGQMIMGLSCESRQALQTAQTSLSLLQQQVHGSADTHDLIDRIQRAQDDLHYIFQQLQAYALPPRLEMECCPLGEVVAEAWGELQVESRNWPATLRIHNNLRSDGYQVDRLAMRQALRNVFENSVEAVDGPVQVDVYLEPAPGTSGTVQIACCDNGPGMSVQQQRHLFEAFYTTKKQGMGLGLCITHRLVSAHGGSVEVGHGRAQGTEIVVRLPARDCSQVAA